jgi:hypothetical protein
VGVYSFYLRSGDGASATLEAFELGGDEHGPARALKMLAEHRHSSYVAVWANQGAGTAAQAAMPGAAPPEMPSRAVRYEECGLAVRARAEAQRWVEAYCAAEDRTDLLRVADGVERSLEQGVLQPDDCAFWHAVSADLRRRAMRGI